MKTIKNSKEITTLEVGDEVVFGNLVYKVRQNSVTYGYYLYLCKEGTPNDTIFDYLNLNKIDLIDSIGINARIDTDFPETRSLEALTAIVSALFKKYEKQNELPKTWEEFCEKNEMGDKKFCLYGGVIIGTSVSKNIIKDSILIDSPEEAQAFRAFMQLRQLRKAYVKDWEPDWTNSMTPKYSITCIEGVLNIFDTVTVHRSMSFPNSKLAKQFFNNFKDLLEIAKPLL